MKKKILIGIIAVIIIAAIAAMIYAGTTLNKVEKEENSHLIEITFDELQNKVDNGDTFILLLSQTTCTHCAAYKPVLKKVLTEYNLYAYVVEIDTLSTEENAKLKDIANISGTPQTIFIQNGSETNTANRISGEASESKIISRLKALGYIDE